MLRRFRERAELSQEGLADAAALHRTHIGFLERGERKSTLDSVDRVLGALGVTWADFGAALDTERAGSRARDAASPRVRRT